MVKMHISLPSAEARARDGLELVKRLATFRAPAELVLLLLALFLLSSLTIASMWLSERVAQDRIESQTAQTVSENLVSLGAALRASESGQRGYLLTGDKLFLDSYNANIGAISGPLAGVETAFVQTDLENEYRSLQARVQEKQAEMAESIRLFAGNERASALRLVKGGSGREIMREISESITMLRTATQERLFISQRQTANFNNLLWYSNLGGFILIIFFASSSMVMLWRSNKTLQVAQAELKANNENLEATISERMQELREANEEVQRFAYIVSHDLRSPLVNIMGFTTELETLSKEIFPPADGDDSSSSGPPVEPEIVRKEFHEALGFIKGSIGKMDRLIGAILKISREGARPFKPEHIDMSSLLNGIAASMTHQTQERGASIIVDPLPRLQSDKLAIEQVFSNLMDNALKFLRRDVPGEIRISARRLNRLIEFQVTDNGRGIDEKDRGRIFELFRRAGAQDRPGEGMGLAYVQTLVRRLGGSIRVESTVGNGSTFSVILPETWSEQPNRTKS